MSDAAVLAARGRLAYASRTDITISPEQLAAARLDFTEAKLAEAIRAAVDAAPPLTPDQCARLAALLTGGGS